MEQLGSRDGAVIHTIMSPLHHERWRSGPESIPGQEGCSRAASLSLRGQVWDLGMPAVPSYLLPARDLEGCLTVVLLKDFLARFLLWRATVWVPCPQQLLQLLLFQGQASGNKRYFASPLLEVSRNIPWGLNCKTLFHFIKEDIILRIQCFEAGRVLLKWLYLILHPKKSQRPTETNFLL